MSYKWLFVHYKDQSFSFAFGEIRHPFLNAFVRLQKVTISFVMSVRPRETARLPLNRFS